MNFRVMYFVFWFKFYWSLLPPKDPIRTKSAFLYAMAWCRTGVCWPKSLTHLCFTRLGGFMVSIKGWETSCTDIMSRKICTWFHLVLLCLGVSQGLGGSILTYVDIIYKVWSWYYCGNRKQVFTWKHENNPFVSNHKINKKSNIELISWNVSRTVAIRWQYHEKYSHFM